MAAAYPVAKTHGRAVGILGLATAIACGCNSHRARASADGASDSVATAAEIGSRATDGAASAVDMGRTTRGVYTCCAPNEGTACCEGIAQGLCFQYGGTVGRCQEEGEVFEGKVICAGCCPGLSPVQPDVVSDVGTTCDSTAPVSMLICVKCGDGVCGEFENRCRCPTDCP